MTTFRRRDPGLVQAVIWDGANKEEVSTLLRDHSSKIFTLKHSADSSATLELGDGSSVWYVTPGRTVVTDSRDKLSIVDTKQFLELFTEDDGG